MEEKPERDNSKAVRILVLILALVAMLALGITTPSARATGLSRLVVSAFTLSLGIVLVTTLALIPSPMDPRERVRRAFLGIERDNRNDEAEAASQGQSPGGTDRAPPEVYGSRDGEG